MTFAEIFEAYYNLYRAEADTPETTDDEYTIGLRLANEAVSRWANYDNTYWKELFTTLQDSTQVSPALVTTIQNGVTSYAAPTDMKEAGGYVRVLNATGVALRYYPIIEPQEAQFKSDFSQYCYFTGNPSQGFTMHLNPAPDSAIIGNSFDYVYYKTPSLFASGADVTEMNNPYFIVNRMLAQRYRVSRNPYYSSAKGDAEDNLKSMQMDNNSGTFANPWKLADNSGSQWGQDNGNGFF